MGRLRLRPVRALRALLIGAMLLSLIPIAAPPVRVRAAAGAPLLILTDSATNPFGTYLQEMLIAEGVKDYEVRPLADLNSELLAGRRAVLLAESSPSGAQVAALDGFVSAGGGLVAMRPVAELDAILGVARQGGGTAEGYLRITDATLGAGLYANTMQFHGAASHYALAGAGQVAELYSSRTASTGYPAATLANRGNGKAAMFSYDLARSVVLTRQGNPANAGLDMDNDGIVRTNDLFMGWIDLERASVPQADMQQRLLVRLLETVMAQPVPRLWYYPNTASSVLVATGDAHGQADSDFQVMIDTFQALGARVTFYLQALPWAQHPAANTVESWRAAGFDFGPHPYASGGYGYNFDDGYAAFSGWYPTMNARTERTHEVRWSGWTAAASEEAAHGTAMDFNFYQFASWLNSSSHAGYLTGSGQPMRFVDASGTILPIYQQHTMLVDEQVAPSIGQAGLGLEPALAVSRAAIDASVGGYHTPITTQFHVGYWNFGGFGEWVAETTRYARQTHGLPSMSAEEWLVFVEQRAATTIANSHWAGDVLTFDIAAGGPGQTTLVPLQYGGSTLTSLRVNGTPLSYPTKIINGIGYALVAVTTGTYTASYAADQTPPTVSATVPQAGATNVVVTAPLSITFSEAMDHAATQSAFSLSPPVAGIFSWSSGDTIMTFAPSAALATSTTYAASVSGAARDRAGNPLVPESWSFTTAATRPPGPIISNVTAGTITTTSATISWATDIPADSRVEFGLTSGYGSSTALDPALTTAHNQTISGLAPGTLYHYRVLSRDGEGTESQSIDGIFVTASASAASAGEWSPVQDWPLVAVHAILQPNGQVLLFDAWEYTGTPSATLWNPTSQTFTGVPNTTTELFCAGHAMLADGRQLIIGGHAGDAVGIPDTNIFDSRTNTWIRVADMHFPRWYPTAVTLADGRILALGGQSQPGVFVEVPEVYDPAANTWTPLVGATLDIGEYPRAALMPDGRVFVSAASTPPQSLILDVAAQTWSTQGLAASTGPIAIYRPGQIIAAGGGTGYTAPVRSAASVIDINGGTPIWQATSPMAYPRYQHNLITLPDGKVLAVGGTTQHSLVATEGVLQAELWDPNTGTWTTLASMQQPRLYHSTALLLPDGRVLVAGGGRAAPAIDYATAQLYSPPYLFAGPRPTITSAPVSAGYGRALTIWTPDAVDIASVALVRLPSDTHGVEFDQRYIPLSFTGGAETLTVQSPGSAGIAPPGVYMLFVVNEAGVPSVATMIQIGGGGQSDTQAPTVALTDPADGATMAGSGVAISATASDNVGVASVQFLLDGVPLGAPVTAAPYTLTWDTTTTANGSHTLSARAMDTIGNTAVSAAITVTVANATNDTTPPIIGGLGPAKITSSYVTLAWTTNEGATSQVEWGLTAAYGNSSTLDPALRTSHSRRIFGLQPSTTYHYRVICRDAAGNVATSGDGVFTTAADTQAPAVQLTAPASNSAVTGQTVTVAATASDNVGVASVQFLLDGVPLGAPVTAAPYTLTWDTTTVANGQHLLTAQARDTVGNIATSAAITVTVANTLTVTRIDPGAGSAGGGTAVTIAGSGFAPGATVSFGGAAATAVVIAGGGASLTAVAPAHAAGPVAVVVANPDGQTGSLPNGFTYVTCPSGCIAQTTVADFAAGTASGTYVAAEGDGELTLAPAAGAEFNGSALPPGWTATPWAAGGGATVSGGNLAVDGALVTTGGYFAPGRSLEFVATFDATAPFQHVGLGHDLNGAPWAIFSTGTGGALYARSNAATGVNNLLPGDWLGAPHRFRITWTATDITYFIDGTQVASHAVGNIGAMRPVVSDSAPGGATLTLDWLRLGPYAMSGTHTSPVLDAGAAATWGTMASTTEIPAGTGLTIYVRTGGVPVPDESWSAYIPVSSGAAIGGSGRYIQYRVELTTTDPVRSPALNNILISYTISATAPVVTTVTPNTGPMSGGTAVTIAGSGFAPGATVSFGGAAATAVVVAGGGASLTAVAPAHAAGPVAVVVANPDGQTGSLPNGFTYLTPPPTVDNISPAIGTTAGGTVVTLRGTNFNGATGVSFGGLAAANFAIVSATTITATTPAQAAGTVDVRVSNAGGSSPVVQDAQFTYVACLGGCFTHTTVGQFSGGTFVNTHITAEGDGELALAPAAGSDFSGAALPPGWSVAPWGAGGTATVANGSLAVNGALVTAGGYFAPGRSLEFVATFDATAPFQHVGLGIDLNSSPWAIFSTGGSGGALYARTHTGGGQADTLLPGDWLGASHRFRITWTATDITYFIDGTQVASHALGNSGEMRPVISDGAPGGAALTLDWLQLGPYAPTGTYTSAILDAGGAATWGTVAWSGSTPSGTSLTISVRAGNTPVPNVSWTTFTPITNGAASGASGRYFQYRAEMATSDPVQTPALTDLVIGYTVTGPAAPTITGLSPSTGPATGGTLVTISGNGFTGATAVTFGGAAANFTVQNDTSITATAPAHAAGTVGVAITTPSGTSGTNAASAFTYQTDAPMVTGISPTSGPAAGGTAVTLTGTAFAGATAVTFGGTPASVFTVNSPTSITATAPPHAAGTIDITVTTPVGTSAINPGDRFTYLGQSGTLAITATDPATGTAAGGTTVRISGANFATGAVVTFGGVAATGVTVTSTTTLTATVPAHAAGTANIVVTNPDTQSATLVNGYTYVTCPTACLAHTGVTDFATAAPGAGSAIVQTADGEVALAPAAGAEFSGAALPSGWSAAPWAPGGGATLAVGFLSADGALVATDTYHGPGRVLEFVATFDGSAPHQHIGLGTDLNSAPWAIFSTGFLGGTLYARTNNGSNQTDTAISGNWLGTPHRFRIEWTATGTIYSIDGTQVAVHSLAIPGSLRPVLSDGQVANGNLSADWLRLSPYATSGVFTSRVFDAAGATTWGTAAWTGETPPGTSLTLSIRTGNTPAPDATWTAFAPLSSGATVGGSARYLQYQVGLATTSPALTPALRDITIGYTVTGPPTPTVTGVSPATGTVAGGTVVVIAGANFATGATVTFGETAATGVAVTSATSITATTPAHATGPVDVIVTNTDGGSGVLPGGYAYMAAPPVITSVSPASGTTGGGTTVSLAGSGFTGATAVSFGGTPATDFTVLSDTAITATAPPRAAGVVDVVVTAPGGSTATTAASKYTYQATAPVVSSLSPSIGPTTGGTVVTISGTGFTGATAVAFDGATAAGFTVISPTSLTATAPAHAAGAINVTVTTPAGTSTAGAGNEFTYLPSGPSVSQISIGTGPATGGTVLTIRGAHLAGATSVTFGGAAASFTVTSATSITATAPAHAPGAADVLVTTPGGASAASAAARFTYVACPSGCAAHTTTADFTSGDQGNTHVAQDADGEVTLAPVLGAEFGGSALLPSLTATPWSAGGAGTVGGGVLTIDGALIAGTSYQAPGRVLEIAATFDASAPFQHAGLGIDLNNTPWAIFSTGSAGGTLYARTIVNGTWYDTPIPGDWLGAPHRFRIEWTAAGVRYLIDGTQVADHAHGNTGNLRVVISDGPVGGGALVVDWLRLGPNAAAGSHTSAVLDAGGAATWGTVAWSGETPAGTALALSIRTGNTPTPDASWGAFASVANGAASGASGRYAQYRVDLTTGDPALTPTLRDITIGYTVSSLPAPTVTGVAPPNGPVAGGTAVTISGTGFTGATAVSFGGTPASVFTVNSPTSITATAPPRAAGVVDVVVTAPGGSTATTAASKYTYQLPPPMLTGLSPAAGPTAGGTTVTMAGTGFTGTTAVTFGGAPAAGFTVVSDTSLTATAPSHAAGVVNVTVTAPAGTSTTGVANEFTYQAPQSPAPTVTGLSPTAGPTTGGTSVAISGTGFTGATAVSFGGTAATSFTVASATSLTAVSPAGVGMVDVSVTTPAGTSAVSAASRFTYTQAPTVTSVSPNSGTVAGGTAVTITGANFVAGAVVTFGGIAATNVVVASATSITATTPARAAGAVAVTVTNPGGQSASLASGYTYRNAPTIATISPTSGITSGNTLVTITGTNFVGNGGTAVTFDGIAGTSVSVSSVTRLTVRSPAHAAGVATVIVTTAGGSTAPGQFTYVPPPAIADLSPNNGPVAGGTVVTITGTAFTGATQVRFGNTNATYSVNSDTTIMATAPARSAGTVNVTVTTPFGSATTPTAERYTYIAPPTVTGLSPASGPAAGGTQVRITGTNFSTVTAVTFGAVIATNFTVNSSTRITAIAPAQVPGVVDVRVTTAGGTSAQAAANRYTYTASGSASPAIAALRPGAELAARRRRKRPGEWVD